MRSHLLAFLALSTAVIFACGGSEPGPQTPAGGSGDPAASTTPPSASASTTPPAPASASTPPPTAADAPGAKFRALPKDKKIETMAAKVVPNVGKLFKEYDGKRYAKFNCVTCHGPDKKDDPHNVLPKLTLSNGGFEKLAKEKPEVMKFMAEKVEPTMAAALDEKPYDQTTHKGFGCAGCHAVN